jgi:hypothetical protein
MDAVPPNPQREWAALISRRIAEIQTFLRRSRPKVESYPTDIDCWHLAHVIEAVRVVNAKNRNRPPYRASPLLECARKFVRELDNSIQSARSGIPPIPAEIIDAIIDQHYPDIRELEAAKRTAEAVVARWEGPEARNPARSIRDALQEAWQRAGEEPNKAALCREVTELLKLAGIHYAPSYIREMLLGRESRPRSGDGRKSPKKVPPDAAH